MNDTQSIFFDITDKNGLQEAYDQIVKIFYNASWSDLLAKILSTNQAIDLRWVFPWKKWKNHQTSIVLHDIAVLIAAKYIHLEEPEAERAALFYEGLGIKKKYARGEVSDQTRKKIYSKIYKYIYEIPDGVEKKRVSRSSNSHMQIHAYPIVKGVSSSSRAAEATTKAMYKRAWQSVAEVCNAIDTRNTIESNFLGATILHNPEIHRNLYEEMKVTIDLIVVSTLEVLNYHIKEKHSKSVLAWQREIEDGVFETL